ncbi:MAG: hypothetical protein J0G33_07035 [Afipia felis]|nr:hypothetical protein [Afipia felis]
MQSQNTTRDTYAEMLGRIGTDPTRLLTVASYWAEFDELTELLDNAQATFEADERALLKLCAASGAVHRPATVTEPAAFPLWLLREFYPANP